MIWKSPYSSWIDYSRDDVQVVKVTGNDSPSKNLLHTIQPYFRMSYWFFFSFDEKQTFHYHGSRKYKEG